MKKFILFAFMILAVTGISATGQEAKDPKKIYNPEANARKDIANAVKKAKAEGKHVMVQIGGNWCGWCILFHGYIQEEPEIKKMIEDNFVFVLMNYSPENKNLDLLKYYRNPGRFGFPVFLILDGKGKLLHTQDSGLLEEGKGYNKGKVLGFLRNWTPKALDVSNIR